MDSHKCSNCRHLLNKPNELIEETNRISCKGDPAGKRWAITVAWKEIRCGKDGKWFKWKDRR